MTDSMQLLRFALRLDALASGASAVLALAGSPWLTELLGTPATLLWPTGLFLLVWAAALWWVASRPAINAAAVWAIIALNLLWVIDSVVLVAAGWFALTVLGTVFVLVQALAVAVFADLEFVGLRRALRLEARSSA
jgi:hypothetical protein